MAAIPGKRELLARGLRLTGALTTLEHFCARRPGLVVFTHHRVVEPADNPFYDQVVSATPDSLRASLKWIKGRFRLPTLDQVLDHLETDRPWSAPTALVTFDDGTRDNFTTAAPILAEFGVPAVFFIPTLFLESPRLPWWDKVAYMIKRTRATQLSVSRADEAPLLLDLETLTRDQAIQALIRAILARSIVDLGAFFGELQAQARVEVDDERLGRELFMTWDQARELAAGPARFAIGSHGHAHARLAELGAAEQRDDLALSGRILEERLGRRPTALAYPYGGLDAFTAETKAITAGLGYRAAFSAIEGVNRPGATDPYSVRRFNCGRGDSVALLRGRIATREVFGGSIL